MIKHAMVALQKSDAQANEDTSHHYGAPTHYLLAKGYVEERQVERAKKAALSLDADLEITLNKLGFVTDVQLLEAYMDTCSISCAETVPSTCPDHASNLNTAFLRKHHAIPLSSTDTDLILGVVNPLDRDVINGVAFATGLNIHPKLISMGDWRRAFAHLYDQEVLPDEIENSSPDPALEILLEQTRDAPIARKIAGWMIDAVERNASDMHLEPKENGLQLRFRIDGVLQDIALEPIELTPAAMARIKVMGDLDLGERRLPQDGRTSIVVRGRPIDVRISIIPTVHGESAVLRLLDKDAVRLDLKVLGFSPKTENWLDTTISSATGLYLVSGPTGSGKTTTLYGALQALRSSGRKILSVEDPVEYYFDHVVQVQVAANIGLDFPTALRSFLRQDPDVILVGEIRDQETAKIAVRAALTGHLVLATVHAIDAGRVPARLLDIGVSGAQLASAFKGAMAQRLVRKLCPKCQVPQKPEPVHVEMYAQAGLKVPEKIYNANGCPHCYQTGFSGRMAIAESFTSDEAIFDAIKDRENANLSTLVTKAIGTSLLVDGLQRVSEGMTTLIEVERALEA